MAIILLVEENRIPGENHRPVAFLHRKLQVEQHKHHNKPWVNSEKAILVQQYFISSLSCCYLLF